MRKICKLAGKDKALPMNTGAEAVETALKAARRWAYDVKGIEPNQAEIIAFNGNFHGRTMAPVSLSSEAEYQRGYGPLLDGFHKVDFGDVDKLKEAINENTAAILVEPIQGKLVLMYHQKVILERLENYVMNTIFYLLQMKSKQV